MADDMISDAWLGVIARDGWSTARIDAVAAMAGVSTGAVAAVAPDRWTALRSYGDMLDRAALAEAATDPVASVRDRLFTMLMERFDAAQPQRAAAKVLADAARSDPALAAFMVLGVSASVARIADAAGVVTTGLIGPLRVQAMTVLYLAVARVWLDDASEDLAGTMKALDTRLEQAERWARAMPYRPTDATTVPEAPRSSVDRPLG